MARSSTYIELKALVISNALEVLRYNFGHNVLVGSGLAVAKGEDIYFPPHKDNGRRMHFEEIILELCKDLKLSGWETRFKDLRNSVVHMGIVPSDTTLERYWNTMDVLNFCDRVVLSLLQWDKIGENYYQVNIHDPLNRFTKFIR